MTVPGQQHHFDARCLVQVDSEEQSTGGKGIPQMKVRIALLEKE